MAIVATAAAAATAPPAAVPSLQIEQVVATAAGVRVVCSAPCAPVTHRLHAANGQPERVVVDVRGAVIAHAVPAAQEGSGAVRRVRAGQFAADTARVVVEVADGTLTSEAREASGITIVVGAPAAPPAAAAPAAAAVPSTVPAAAAAPAPIPPAGAAPSPPPPGPATTPAPSPARAAAVPPARAAVVATDVRLLGPLAPPADPLAVPGDQPLPPLTSRQVPPTDAPSPSHPTTPSVPTIIAAGPARMVWPPLDAPLYADAPELRDSLLHWWTDGTVPPAPALIPGTIPPTGTALLAADVRFLRALAGRDDPLDVYQAYVMAARLAGDDPEGVRAEMMAGYTAEWLKLGPEAGTAFGVVAQQHPDNPLAPWARLGVATSLRLRRRVPQARAALAPLRASSDAGLRCAALLEEVRQAKAANEPASALGAMRTIAADCLRLLDPPSVRREVALTLADAGVPDEARQLLTAPRPTAGPDEEAQLDLLDGDLALRANDQEAARAAYTRVLGRRVNAVTRTEAERRMAQLGDGDPARAVGRLKHLAEQPLSVQMRASLLAEAADAASRAGKHDAAFALLAQADDLGGAGPQTADAKRAELLSRWIGELSAVHDWMGLATVYAAHATDVRRLGTPADRRALAVAFLRLGLPGQAVDLVRQDGTGRNPEGRLVWAETALEAEDRDEVRAALAPLVARGVLAPLAPRLAAARAGLALLEDDALAAAEVAGESPEPALAARIAVAALATGTRAADAGALDTAARAYGVAQRLAGERADVAAAAAAGLARVALARGDGAAAGTALAGAEHGGNALATRAVAALERARGIGPATDDDAAAPTGGTDEH